MTSPFPVSTNTSAEGAQVGTHTIALPSGINTSGRLIVVILSYGVTGTTFSNWPSGWTPFGQTENTGGGTNGYIAAYHYTTGSEGYAGDGSDTITVNSDKNTRSAHHAYHFSGAENPATQAPESSATPVTNAVGPDPPSITPTGGPKDFTFIAGGASSLDGQPDTAPTNYTGLITNNTGGTNAAHSHLVTAWRSATVSSEDPNAFANDPDDGVMESVPFTIAIHPAGAAQALVRLISETENLNEARQGIRGLLKPVGEVLSAIEAVFSPRKMGRLIGETISLTEFTVRSRTLARILNETEGLVETLTRALALVRTRNETISVGESAAQIRALLKIISETLTFAETILDILEAAGAALVKIVPEVVQLTENTTRTRALVRLLAELETMIETAARRAARVRSIQESLTPVEGVVTARDLTRVVSELLSLGEMVLNILSAVGGIIATILESLSISEATLYPRGMARVLNNVEQILETFLRTRSMSRAAPTTLITLQETTGMAQGMVRVLDEIEQIAEVYLRQRGMLKIILETVAANENISQMVALFVGALRTWTLQTRDLLRSWLWHLNRRPTTWTLEERSLTWTVQARAPNEVWHLPNRTFVWTLDEYGDEL